MTHSWSDSCSLYHCLSLKVFSCLCCRSNPRLCLFWSCRVPEDEQAGSIVCCVQSWVKLRFDNLKHHLNCLDVVIIGLIYCERGNETLTVLTLNTERSGAGQDCVLCDVWGCCGSVSAVDEGDGDTRIHKDTHASSWGWTLGVLQPAAG